MIRRDAIIFFFLLLAGCGKTSPPLSKGDQYLDIQSIISHQINFLSKKNISVEKKTFLNGTGDTAKVNISAWHKEFAPFMQLDLNKSSHRQAFKATGTVKSDTIFNHYLRKKDVDSDILMVKAAFNTKNQLLYIFAIVQRKNVVFSASKTFLLQFDPLLGPDPILTSYHLSGEQGFVFGSKDKFAVDNRILY